MNLRQGLQSGSGYRIEEVLAAASRPDTVVYLLPELGVRDRESFFEAVRERFPLDPPVYSSYSWDALEDSIWGGIDALDVARVVIIWPQSRVMAEAAPADFEIAISVWEDLANSLNDKEATVGRPKEVCVVLM